MRLFTFIEIKFIRLYQILFSFDHGIPHKLFPFIRICVFEPSCSQYMSIALKKHGLIKGNYLGVKRIVRCGPWSFNRDKYDPVP